MKHFRHCVVPALTLAAALALSACGKQESPPPAAPAPAAPAPAPAPATPAPTPAAPETTVTAVQIGNALDANGKIVAHDGTYSPKDTIYAQVTTQSTGGAGNASIAANWTFGDGQPVNQSSESISTAAGTATTTFHVSKPDGWPPGKYTVQISVDGKPASNATFEVK